MKMYCDRHMKLLPKGKCNLCQERNLICGMILLILTPGVLVSLKLIADWLR